jgi:peptidoglycan/LPS O-acetylase OafA/YrhL
LWTINVELGFYVLVPLLFTRYIRQRRWLLNTMLVTAAAASIWASSIKAHLLKVDGSALSTYLLAYGPLPFLWVFLLGASGYLNWDRVRPWIVGRFGTWLSAYLLLTLIDIYGFGAPTVDLMKVTPLVVMKTILLAGTVLSFAYSFRRLSSVLKGIDLSYGLYLYHMPLIFVLLGFGFRESVWLWPVVYASTAGVAGLSWFLVERPTLALKARWRLRGASSVSSAGEGAGAPLKGVR